MADKLTLRLKEELERRHGKGAVSDAQIKSFLKTQNYNANSPSKSFSNLPYQTNVADIQKYAAQQPPTQDEKSGLINAVGAGLWTFFDTASFGALGIASSKTEEAGGQSLRSMIDFSDTAAKYTGAVGGLAGFVKGAPLKVGAKILGGIGGAVVRATGKKSINQVSSKMLKRGAELGVKKDTAREITNHYANLARKAQSDVNFQKTFGEKATKLLVNYTDDAVQMGKISQAESVAIRKMFGENYMKRPMQDFIGLMSTRIANPRLARVAGSLLNESIMFAAIDTIFEGVSMIEDHHFDWTAPVWGAFTGVAFSQIQWLNPVGKGHKWGLDFRAGVRGAFSKKPEYHKMGNKELKGVSKFFGESLNRFGKSKDRFGKPRNENDVVNIEGKTIDLSSDNVLMQATKKFGGIQKGKDALIGFFESQRKFFGKELMKASTGEGLRNIQKNWFRMAAGGVAFNAHTLAEMALHGTTPGFHDMLPHFLIGAFLQIGKNPASFDLSSTKMNQLRSNLKMLGVNVDQLNYVPSLARTPNRFNNGMNRETHPETLRMYEELGIGSDIIEATDISLREGDISIRVRGNAKYDKIAQRLHPQFRHEKNPDNISTKDAQKLVDAFEAETGVKRLEDYDRHFDNLAVENTALLERDIPTLVKQVMLADKGQELGMNERTRDGKKIIQGPEVIMASEEIYKLTKSGVDKKGNKDGTNTLDFIKDAEGNTITNGTLALEKLNETLDGYSQVFRTSKLLNEAIDLPSDKTTKTIRTLDTIKDIYQSITLVESKINEAFPSKMSYSDAFTFKKSASDYLMILANNINLKNSAMIRDIFSKNYSKRDDLISLMKAAGILQGDLVNPKLLKNIENIEFIKDESLPESEREAREGELRRGLKKILQLQSVTGGYERSEGVDIKKIEIADAEKLIGFISEAGLKDVHNSYDWMHQETINFIIRDKIGSSNLQMHEMTAFFEIAEAGMANFNLDMKSGRQGFDIKLIDESVVPEHLKSVSGEYNDFVRKIIARSGGLIESSGKSIVQNEYDLLALKNILPQSKESSSLNRDKAQEYLYEFMEILPKNSQILHQVAQYSLEGGSSDVLNWLIRAGVMKYDNKSSKQYEVNAEKFTEELKVKLQNKIKKNGPDENYIKDVISSEEQLSRAAHNDVRFMVDMDSKFDMNTFVEKYNIDNRDYSVESKERKREVFDSLFLSEVNDPKARIPAAQIVDNVLKRISVKNTTTGKYERFLDIKGTKAQYDLVHRQIVGDLVKLIASQYNTTKVNTIKMENGQIKESTKFQQETRLNTLLRELELSSVQIEKEVVDYEMFEGRMQRVFKNIFTDTTDLPNWQRVSIKKLHEKLIDDLKLRESSFGLTNQGGMRIFQISKDTAPLAISLQDLPNMHPKYIEFADWALKQKNIDRGVKGQIQKIIDKINEPTKIVNNEEIGNPTTPDYQYMLSQIVFNDMLRGSKKTSALEDFLNGFDVSKTMGRIKLYDSKNFVKHDRSLLSSMMELYKKELNDSKTHDAIGKIFQQDGFNVAIWNDKDYANVHTEVRSILKENGMSPEKIDKFFKNVINNAHEKASSFDSIAFVPMGMMRYAHSMMGNNPNSTNPVKPAIASGGRSGQLLLGKTLLVYDKSLDTFFRNNNNVDILLASTGAKSFNKGLDRDGLDTSLINKPYNQINSTTVLGAQKIRKIPIDALGFKPEVDKPFKDAVESTSDYNYMTNSESKNMYKENYRDDIIAAVEGMRKENISGVTRARFIKDIFGNDAFSVSPESGGSQHLSNIAKFVSMHRDADPMSYSENIVKNKIYNHYINRILNGKRTTIKIENGNDVRYGGQSHIIQVADARHRLRPTYVNEEGKMEMRGEIMIGHHERLSSVSEIVESGRQLILVDNAKTIDPKEFFGSYESKREGKKYYWDEMLKAGLDLGSLYDIIESGKTQMTPIYSKNLQIGVVTNRKPHTRPNDTAILGLKGFLDKAYGRSALVNSLDIVNLFEGDYDADKVDYFYGARKAVHEHAKRVSDLFVQAIDPDYLKIETKFSWADDPSKVAENIERMAASSDLAKKTIGVVQKIPRKLGFLNNVAMDGKNDPGLMARFGKDKKPKILFMTPGKKGEEFRITMDFDNMDYYTRAALETQYMLDMGGGVNPELMRDVSEWSDKFLFPDANNGITPSQAKKIGIGFINSNIRRKTPSKRIRIFRKFDKEGNELVLNDLEKSMIKTMMSEYGKFLNVAGNKTFNQKTGEQRSITYDNVYDASDSFFNFNRDLSKSLYYKLRYKKDSAGNPFYKDGQFINMFGVKEDTYQKYDKKLKKMVDKTIYKPEPGGIFVDASQQIKNNSIEISKGKRGGVLERALYRMWDADVFGNRKDAGLEASFNDVGNMVQYMNRWYDQLRTGDISEYSGSIDALQGNIMKTVTDYNSAAYYIGNLKKKIVTTQYRTDLPYKAKKAIIDKLNKVIRGIEYKLADEIVPPEYRDTYKTADLKPFKFIPIKGKDVEEGQVQFNTTYSILKLQKDFGVKLSADGFELLKYLKDIRRQYYSNQENLGDIFRYKEKTVLNKQNLEFLANMPEQSTFREVEDAIMHKGLKEFGTPFILEFMATTQNKRQIGIQGGRLVAMPFSKSARFRRGYQFLTSVVNAPKSNDKSLMANYESNETFLVGNIIRALQVTEANFRRFQKRRYDKRNFSDSNYMENIGTIDNPVYLTLEHIRLPSFGKELENVVGDYASIRWARDTNRISSGFDNMNDSVLSYYRDIMEVAGKGPEFEKYVEIMHGLKQDMIKNKTIDPIKYLATKAQIESDISEIANKVLTGGIDTSKNQVAYKRLLQNPMHIINGGDGESGFFRGISLGTKSGYSANRLREIVKVHEELSKGETETRFRTEKSEKDLDRFLGNCKKIG